MDSARSTRTLSRRVLLTLGISLLFSQLGCLSASSPGNVAMLRYTVEARTTSGELLDSTQFHIETAYPYDIRNPKRTVRTDSEGRLEVTELRERDPSNPFILRAAVPGWMRIRFHFPEVHPISEYEVNLMLDPEHPCWNVVQGDLMRGPPPQVEASPEPEGRRCLDGHGPPYVRTKEYYSTTLLADGNDTRRVPFRWRPPIGAAQGEPRLEVRVKATPLVGERGHRLHIWLIAPDPYDHEAERSELLRSLRGHLERVEDGQTIDPSDLNRQDLVWLHGMSREEFREALGEPDYCVVSWYRAPGTYEYSHPEVPCDHENADFVYRFFHGQPLPESDQELRLVIGEEGTCMMSFWEPARLDQ